MLRRRQYRGGGALALSGAVLLLAGTWLHPASADANDPVAAFSEYADTSRPVWVTAHLTQFASLAAMILAIVVLSGAARAAAAGWARTTAVLGAAALALAATLQAADGIALKATVDLWASAAAGQRPALFSAAVGVRQLEIGLDSLFALVFGAAILCFAVVLLTASSGSRSLGVLAVAAAAMAGVNGVLLALGGFSPAAMLATLGSGAFGALLMVATAGWSWREAARTEPNPDPAGGLVAAPSPQR